MTSLITAKPKRDKYRVSRGTKSGFAMHYTKAQCSRAATCADNLCGQHASAGNPAILEQPYYEFV